MTTLQEPREVVLEAACPFCHGKWSEEIHKLRYEATFRVERFGHITTECPHCHTRLNWEVKQEAQP